MSTAVLTPGGDLARYCDALHALDPSMPRDDWFRVACAFKDAGGSLDEFDGWSAGGPSYDKADVRSMWRSIKPGKTTAATLIAMARDAGWLDDSMSTRPSPEEVIRRKAERVQRQVTEAKAEERRHAEAAERAQRMWSEAKPASSDHPYLQRKRIQAHGIRVGRWVKVDSHTGEVRVISDEALLVPLRRKMDQPPISLQAILPTKLLDGGKRDKDSLTGGSTTGLYHAIGRPQRTDGNHVIVVTEGYANGASIHEATGHGVVVAFGASNLAPVARLMRERLPGADIVIFSDRDAEALTKSGGTKAALKAALASGARIVVPEWCGIDGRDANDIHCNGLTWGGETFQGTDILSSCVKFATPYRSPAFMELLKECGIEAEDLTPGMTDGALERATSEQAAPARDDDRRREQQDENKRIQEVDAGAMIPSQLTLDEMLERGVYVAEKKFVAYVTDDRSIFLKLDEFRVLTTASKTEIEVMKKDKAVTKMVPTAGLWLLDKRRVDTMTATFRAGAPNITVNPKGLRAVNTWRPTQRWPAKVDISPFLDQVEYLFPDPSERTVFLDWLAHIEQKPGELPHYGWLHVAESTGTGRNWLASLLARVFRGYTAPNVDLAALLDSQFNGELGGCVLAIVDEVQEGGSEGNYQHAQRLKSMINAEMRTVNNKYGMQYLEFNALRWLVFSNHKNALPLNDSDRRFRVVMHKALPRSPAVYEGLYALLADPEFVNAVGVYLSERDISGFKPGERPPLNADKIAAIAASKPMSTQGAEEVVAAWPSDVITNKNLVELLSGTTERKEFTPAMRRAMEEVGAQSWHQGKVHKIKIGNSSHRIWVLRNHAKWFAESTGAIREEISRAGVDDLADKPAAVILADAAERMEGPREPAF